MVVVLKEKMSERNKRLAISVRNQCTEMKVVDMMDVYQLLPLKNNSTSSLLRLFMVPTLAGSSFRRLSFGEPDRSAAGKTSKTILLMGATGSGKTTWINAMVNYVYGVDVEDPFRLKLVDEEDGSSIHARSQTQEITAYDLHYQEGFRIPFSLTVVDTPVFGESGGEIDAGRDQEIASLVREFFSHPNGIQELDAVGFVVQSSLARLTSSQTSIFNSVLEIFGKDIGENILFLTTFSDGDEPKVLEAIKEAKLPCKLDANGSPCYKSFNNYVIYKSSKSGNEKRLGLDWKEWSENFASFFEELAKMEPKSLQMTVPEMRQLFGIQLDVVNRKITNQLMKIEELRKTVEMIKDDRLKVQVLVMNKVKVPLHKKKSAVNCANCQVTCVDPESLPFFEQQEKLILTTGTCRVCPSNCPSVDHKKEDYKWDFARQEETITMDDVRQRYEPAEGRRLSAEEMLNGLQNEVEQLKSDILTTFKEITRCCNELSVGAVLTTPQHIQKMMTNEEDYSKPGYAERIEILREIMNGCKLTENIPAFPGDKKFDYIDKSKSLPETSTKSVKSTEQIAERRPCEFKLDWDDMICSGYYRAIYHGSFKGKQVAIKRVPTDKTQFQEKEEKIIGQLDHPNVIKLLQVTEDFDFRYYIFELAAGTVDDFCLRIYRGKMPSDDEALKQMAEGLLYIHGKRFAHLNISPYSVYISTSEPVRLMIAKFGSCEPTTDTGTFSIGCDNEGGETDWMAPEILKYFDHLNADDSDDGKEPINTFSIACDTWSLGCLFFYFLTRGVHPYGEDDDAIRWNIVVKQNPAELAEVMQASKHEKVYDLIRDMIETEPGKRVSLESVIMGLETWVPPSATSHQESSQKDDQPNPTAKTQDGDDESSKKSSTNKEIERGNVYETTASGDSSCENMPEVEGKIPDVREKDGDRTDKTRVKEKAEEMKCCIHCDKKLKEIDTVCDELKKNAGSAQEKLGRLNELAVRSFLKSGGAGKIRIVSTLNQLVKCYSEAMDEEWTEKDVNKNCQRVVQHLKAVNSQHHFCLWYYSQAKQQRGLAPGLAVQLENTPIVNPGGEINWNIVKFYKGSGTKLQNYLSGPISNWDDFYEPSGPIFLLALYQSIKGKIDLLSFPPPGELTMDVPLKISRALFSVYIEVGEIKSTNKEKVMTNAKLQLRRSLLCFKWLDELLSQPKEFSYGLIGNIYITGNCPTQKENESKKDDEDCLKKEGIVIYRKYKMYK